MVHVGLVTRDGVLLLDSLTEVASLLPHELGLSLSLLFLDVFSIGRGLGIKQQKKKKGEKRELCLGFLALLFFGFLLLLFLTLDFPLLGELEGFLLFFDLLLLKLNLLLFLEDTRVIVLGILSQSSDTSSLFSQFSFLL